MWIFIFLLFFQEMNDKKLTSLHSNKGKKLERKLCGWIFPQHDDHHGDVSYSYQQIYIHTYKWTDGRTDRRRINWQTYLLTFSPSFHEVLCCCCCCCCSLVWCVCLCICKRYSYDVVFAVDGGGGKHMFTGVSWGLYFPTCLSHH